MADITPTGSNTGFMSTDMRTNILYLADKSAAALSNSYGSASPFLKQMQSKNDKMTGSWEDLILKTESVITGKTENNTAAQNAALIKKVFVNDGDAKVALNGGGYAMGRIKNAHVGSRVMVTKREYEDAMKVRGALSKLVTMKLKDWSDGVMLGILYGIFNGLGSTVTPEELTGFAMIFNNALSYGGISITDYPWYKSKVWNLQNVGTTPVWGYGTLANIDTRAEIISTTNSMTPNLIIIFDWLRNAIRELSIGGDKPDLILVNRKIFEFLDAANEARMQGKNWANYQPDPIYNGFNGFKFDGVNIMCEDSRFGIQDGGYDLMPENQIYVLNTKYLHFALDPIKPTPLAPIEGQWNVEASDMSGAVNMWSDDITRQGCIVLPDDLA